MQLLFNSQAITIVCSRLINIENKLLEIPVDKLIKSEWEEDNFFIKEMIYSLMDMDVPDYGRSLSCRINRNVDFSQQVVVLGYSTC